MAHRGSCLLVMVLLLQISRPGNCTNDSKFCARTLSRPQCPATLPTFDEVELQKYKGRWYEIGVNAFFKNLQEAGGICVSAFYTPAPEGFLEVFNSQTRVLTDVGSSVVQRISLLSAQICQQARQICSEIFSKSLVRALGTISKVADKIEESYPQESAILLEGKAVVEEGVSDLDNVLDYLSKGVSQIQILNSKLSQSEGSPKDVTQELKDIANQIVSVATDSPLQAKLSTIATARGKIEAVASKLGGKLSKKLLEAAAVIKQVEGEISGYVAPIRANATATAEAATTFAGLKNEGVGGIYSIQGKAVPNATSPGKLLVSFDNIPTPPAKYWILKVFDEESEDYDAAIVYGCEEIPGGGTYQPLFFLSREPTLSNEVIKKFFDHVHLLGIYQDCHEVFVFSSQPESCQYPKPPSY